MPGIGKNAKLRMGDRLIKTDEGFYQPVVVPVSRDDQNGAADPGSLLWRYSRRLQPHMLQLAHKFIPSFRLRHQPFPFADKFGCVLFDLGGRTMPDHIPDAWPHG